MVEQNAQERAVANPQGVSPLATRTVQIGGTAQVVRLEPSYWEALDEISRREGRSVEDLCTELKERLDKHARRRPPVSLANALRVFVVGYYRQAATDKGHIRAGHGCGDPFVSTPFDGLNPIAGALEHR
ncbi:ribbon-helix-helix domain-containing protein [Azospirillum halopraeferens]|uniref:ribbon-helix-helix domain-containing protein n=1 Tax=Azospirillum halopraeferens TaxID=34010 RepID=UPI000A0233E7|nr:ribbon-helix-helix domain-containing protein [Azospirillum halopraeferens]